MASKRIKPMERRHIYSFVHNHQFYVGHIRRDCGYERPILQRFDFSSAQWSDVSTTSEVQKRCDGFGWHKSPDDYGMCCAVLGDCAYMFGGLRWENRYAVHELNLETMVWRELKSKNREEGPIQKEWAGMVACGSGALCVFGGCGHDIERRQPGAVYHFHGPLPLNLPRKYLTNELHLFHIETGTWSSPETTGPRPPPCVCISFTKVDQSRAVLLGGEKAYDCLTERHILDMECWNWSRVVSFSLTTPWPPWKFAPRGGCGHNACVLFGPTPYAFEGASTEGLHSSSSGTRCNPQLLVIWAERGRAQIFILDVNSEVWKPVKSPLFLDDYISDFSLGCHNRSRTEAEVMIYGGYCLKETTLLYLGMKTLYHSCVDYVAERYELFQPLLQPFLPPHIQTDIRVESAKRAHYRVMQL